MTKSKAIYSRFYRFMGTRRGEDRPLVWKALRDVLVYGAAAGCLIVIGMALEQSPRPLITPLLLEGYSASRPLNCHSRARHSKHEQWFVE